MAKRLYSGVLIALACFLIYIGFFYQSYKVGLYVPTNATERQKIIKEWEFQLKNRPYDPMVLRNLGLYLGRETFEVKTKPHTEYTIKILRRALQVNPDGYEIMSVLGNVLSFSTMFIKNDIQKLNERFNEGIELMDKAVEMEPNHVGINLQRAYSDYYSPMFLNRTQKSISGFKKALDMVGDDYGPHFLAITMYHIGTAYKMLGDDKNAKLYLKKVINLKLPKNEWFNKTKQVLIELESEPFN